MNINGDLNAAAVYRCIPTLQNSKSRITFFLFLLSDLECTNSNIFGAIKMLESVYYLISST